MSLYPIQPQEDQFGISGLPGLPLSAPSDAPSQPFVWGQGGQRLLPEDIARKRQMAQALMQSGMDYSPVGSWTQGLARAAQGILGGIQSKQADKASAANAQASAATVASLLGGGGGDNALLAASVDPYASDDVKSVAKMLYQRNTPAAKQPNEFQQKLIDSGITPGSPEWIAANKQAVSRMGDPFITANTPGGGFYAGPQSGFATAMGIAPQAPSAPPQAAVDDLLSGKGTDAQFDETFGAGAAAKVRASPGGNLGIPAGAVSPGGSTPTALSMTDALKMRAGFPAGPQGAAQFRAWAAKHNVKLP